MASACHISHHLAALVARMRPEPSSYPTLSPHAVDSGSLVYEALCTGKRVGGGGVPRGPSRPVVESLSRSSVMVKVRQSGWRRTTRRGEKWIKRDWR